MAVDVSYLVRAMNGSKKNNPAVDAGAKSTDTITQDLLGGGNFCTNESTELDLDLQVPAGWEKRLDLKSGKVYLQKSGPQSKNQVKESFPNIQKMNYIPSFKQPLALFDEPSLDLKLVSSSSPRTYQSVCTLDKVKSALERAEKLETSKKRSFSKSLSPAGSSSTSSFRGIETETDILEGKSSSSGCFAAGCPNCFAYVLVPRNNPECPRCRTVVPSPPVLAKKPRFDLNISI